MDNVSGRLMIELCGRLADVAGREVAVPLPEAGMTAAALLALVSIEHPALSDDIERGRVRVCVNDAIVSGDAPVGIGDAVALFPPVSGG